MKSSPEYTLKNKCGLEMSVARAMLWKSDGKQWRV